ncbi:MAG: hypothetical protein K0Q90_1985 [Paenibacillaceae bacterium]|jgi:hypothetical protein|nr:hypothetical protein [Paenibacillaceae bacterium]
MKRDEMLSSEDERTVELLRSSLDALDRMVPVAEPDHAAFAAQLEKQQRLLRKLFIRELLLFLAMACSFLGVMGLMLVKLPSLFMVVYGAGFLLPVLLAYKERKRVKEG